MFPHSVKLPEVEQPKNKQITCSCGAILTATLLTRKEQVTERLVEVNLEPGETLLYQVEQVLEVRSGELQKGI